MRRSLMAVCFLLAAEQEVFGAPMYHEAQTSGLDTDFLDEVDLTGRLIPK